MVKQFIVYILANKKHGTLYVGVTSNIRSRIYQHRNKLIEGFTKKYNATLLVYYEIYEEAVVAIEREKQIKKWRRDKKTFLINQSNPDWRDLYSEL